MKCDTLVSVYAVVSLITPSARYGHNDCCWGFEILAYGSKFKIYQQP